PTAIESRKRVRFHLGTAELMARVILLGQDRLQPGQSAFAQIRVEEPTFGLPGDRFILRQYSPMITIGGGEILDAMPEKHRSKDRSVVEKLGILKDGTVEDRIMAVIDEVGLQAIELSQLAARRGLPADRGRERITALAKSGRIRTLSEN